MTTTNTNANPEVVVTNNQKEEKNMNNEQEVTVKNNEGERAIDKEMFVREMAAEFNKKLAEIESNKRVAAKVAKYLTKKQKDQAMEEMIAKIAEKTVKGYRATEKVVILSTAYTIQNTGTAVRKSSEQGVKLGTWMEEKGKAMGSQFTDELIIEAKKAADAKK